MSTIAAITTIAAVWITALALLVLFLRRSVRTAHRAIRCPIHGTDERVAFLEVLPEGRPIEVTECSKFTATTAITCDQRCLAQLAHPPAGKAA